MNTLYLSHNGMTEALGQSQVLPYLRGLAACGFHIDLLACEPHGTPAATVNRLAADLLRSGIRYTPLRRRPGAGLSDKARDCWALLLSGLMSVRRKLRVPRVIHARAHVPGAVADALRAILPGSRQIFDLRGLIPDEYVVLGNWTESDLRYRLTQRLQDHLLRRADKVVVLTEALRRRLLLPDGLLHGQPDKIAVVPCCVDTERFAPDPVLRARRRAELGLSGGQPLLVFAGSLRRYDFDAMLGLFQALRRQVDARLLLLTRDDAAALVALLRQRGLGAAVQVVASAPVDVPGWLAAADLAVAMLKRDRTSIAASPTKVAEYLAVGLPTALTAGIGDNDRLIGPGLLHGDGSPESCARLASHMLEILQDPSAARLSARQTALRHYSLSRIGVPRYRALYDQLGQPGPPGPPGPPEPRGRTAADLLINNTGA